MLKRMWKTRHKAISAALFGTAAGLAMHVVTSNLKISLVLGVIVMWAVAIGITAIEQALRNAATKVLHGLPYGHDQSHH